MKKYTSPILEKEYWVTSQDNTEPFEGLPVYTKTEIELIKNLKHKLTKEDHQMLYEMKLTAGGTLYEVLAKFDEPKNREILKTLPYIQEIYKILGRV